MKETFNATNPSIFSCIVNIWYWYCHGDSCAASDNLIEARRKVTIEDIDSRVATRESIEHNAKDVFNKYAYCSLGQNRRRLRNYTLVNDVVDKQSQAGKLTHSTLGVFIL